MKPVTYKKLQKIWESIPVDEKIKKDIFDISEQKYLLDLFHTGGYYYFIANAGTSEIEMISPEIQNILGYLPGEMNLTFLANSIHPEDMPYYLNFNTAITGFFAGLSGSNLFKYKIQYDFRLKKADGSYIRVLNQSVIIQQDDEDIRTFVINTDISHLKKDIQPVLSFIGLEGQPSYYNVNVKDIFKSVKPFFTKREKDILRALAKGMNSMEIGNALHISKHTVDAHRKNMLKKTNARSTNEILGIAFNNGWM